MSKIVFVGINYKTPEKTIMWIKAIKKNEKQSLVIIVDNSYENNKDLFHDIQKLCYENVIYLNTEDNLGYFNGAYYAYQYLLKNKMDFSWFIVSNVDIELVSNDVGRKLKKFDKYGVVAPQIKSINIGVDKNPYRLNRATHMSMLIKKVAFSNPLSYAFYSFVSKLRNKRIHKKTKEKILEGTSIYMPYGACIIFNKLFFENGGTINYPLFLFGEELFVAEQCRRKMLDVVYVPSISFLNYDHASTGLLHNDFKRKCNYKAISYILKEYY